MKSFPYAFLALLTISARVEHTYAAGASEDHGNADLGSALRAFIDAFQRIMPCGYEPMGLPVMAPFTLPYYQVNISTDFFKAEGHVSNLVVSGLNKFRLLGGSYNSPGQLFTYDMLYPELQVLAEKQVKEWLLLAGLPLELQIDGFINVKVKDLRFVGEFAIVEKPNANGTLEMQVYEMNFYVGNVIVRNWNKNWDISLNNFANKFIGESLEMFDAQIQPYLKHIYEQYVLPMTNEGLRQLTMPELIEAYFGVAAHFDDVGCQLNGNLV